METKETQPFIGQSLIHLITGPKCKMPNCIRYAGNRGICRSCYGACVTLIKAGLFSWDDLEKKGHTTKPNRRGRPKKK